MSLKMCFALPIEVTLLLSALLLVGCAAGAPHLTEAQLDKDAVLAAAVGGNDGQKTDHAGQGLPAKGATISGKELSDPQQSAAAQPGDLVTVNYTATLEGGAVFSTTLESSAKDPAVKKVPWFAAPGRFGAEEILAGGKELLPGLGDAVLGMQAGEKKDLKLAAEQAFGLPDPGKRVRLPCARTFPRIIRMTAEAYVKQFSSFPVLNQAVDLAPYFKAQVTAVTEHEVTLEFQAKDGETFSDSYGTVTVTVLDDSITTALKPVIGAEFPIRDETGIIAETDGETFTVDSNSPLAGKTVYLRLEVVTLTKAAALQTAPVDWVEDHDSGLARAKQEGRPLFLLLYADWCGWCRKTMTETIPDPRVSRFKDKFVWVKVNSDKETKYQQQYGQNGYPLMLVLNPDGTLRKRIDGYRDARGLKEELEGVL